MESVEKCRKRRKVAKTGQKVENLLKVSKSGAKHWKLLKCATRCCQHWKCFDGVRKFRKVPKIEKVRKSRAEKKWGYLWYRHFFPRPEMWYRHFFSRFTHMMFIWCTWLYSKWCASDERSDIISDVSTVRGASIKRNIWWNGGLDCHVSTNATVHQIMIYRVFQKFVEWHLKWHQM